MHLILTYLSVFVFISSSITSTSLMSVTDYSRQCTKGRTIYTYLTTAMGSSDMSIGMVANENNMNCILKYSVSPKNYVMLVIEFPDWMPNQKICNHNENSVVMVSNSSKENVCDLLEKCPKSSAVYKELHEESLSLHINSLKNLSTIKITATGLRSAHHSQCTADKEVECVYKSKVYCMNIATNCDGNSNCGEANSFDEDLKKCEEPKLTALMIITFIITLAVSCCLVLSIIMNLLPKRKETFMYRFNRITLFDNKKECVDVEIMLQVISQEGKEKGSKKEKEN